MLVCIFQHHGSHMGEQKTMDIIEQLYIAGWWFGTMEFYDFPYIGNKNPN